MIVKDYIIFFFFNDTATTEIYPLSLHDALPISPPARLLRCPTRTDGSPSPPAFRFSARPSIPHAGPHKARSEEHTSELQSQSNLVCRLLLEKKKKTCRLTVYESTAQQDDTTVAL